MHGLDDRVRATFGIRARQPKGVYDHSHVRAYRVGGDDSHHHIALDESCRKTLEQLHGIGHHTTDAARGDAYGRILVRLYTLGWVSCPAFGRSSQNPLPGLEVLMSESATVMIPEPMPMFGPVQLAAAGFRPGTPGVPATPTPWTSRPTSPGVPLGARKSLR